MKLTIPSLWRTLTPVYPLLALVLAGLGGLAPAASAFAQVDPWECTPAATLAPTASPSPVESPVAVPFPAEGGSLTVFAAASLTDAFEQMAADIRAANPDLEITFNFAGSQALVTQIAQGGANADVLALASPTQMEHAAESRIAVDGAVTFATNRLVVAVPADNPAGIASPADLAKDDLRLVLANPDVPAGAYARQAICLVATAAGMPDVSGFAANVVSEEDNVRSVLTKVALGEADAGIVYLSDVNSAGDAVRTISISPNQNVVAEYPIAAISDNPLAAAFVGYVFSEKGQATLASFGFDPVNRR